MQIFFFTLNDANWEDNNVPYERRVVADLGNGQKERGKVHAQIKFSHYTRVGYIPSLASACLFPALLCLETTDIPKYCPKRA